LLMADLLWEKSTAGWWLISQANRVGIGNRWRWWRERVQLMYCVEDIWCDLIWRVHAWICFAASKTSTDPFIVLQLFVLFFFLKKDKNMKSELIRCVKLMSLSRPVGRTWSVYLLVTGNRSIEP
jgi:hypothetical protein